MPELRFTADETADLLTSRLGLPLSAGEVAALHRRSEGWAAGLSLLAASLGPLGSPEERARLLGDLSRSERFVFDYLAEEVLDRQDPFTRTFLLETAILPELTPQACQALTGRADTPAILDELYRRNLFLVKLLGEPAAGAEQAAYRYHELFRMMLTPPSIPGLASHDTAYTLREPSDVAIDELVTCAMERPSPMSLINIHHVHGAATRVAPDATAFALREPHYSVINVGAWLEGTGEAETAWAWLARARMAPYASRGLYVNCLGDEGEEAVRDAYRANYDRLAAIKARYDADNIFRRNQNIRPAAW